MKQKEKREITEPMEQFLDGLAQKTRSLADHIDTQTNILIGLSSAIFLFSLTIITTKENVELYFLILGLFSGVSAFISLLGVHPPKVMRKQGQEESLLYNKYIAGFANSKDYAGKLNEILGDRDAIVGQYAIEIYNLSKYYYRPKRKLFHLARNVLVAGIILTNITFLIKILLYMF